MKDFKTFGEVANNLLKNLTSEYVDKLCNRHIAMVLTDNDGLSAEEKENIKGHFRYFSSDVKEQVLGLGDCKDDSKKSSN